VPVKGAKRVHVHTHCFQSGTPAKIGQVHDKGAADDLRPQPLDQADAGFGGAAGGQQVIDKQHGFAGLHGIGRLKVKDLERYGDPAKLAAMRAIKAALDPAGIMNPGAVLRGQPTG